MERFIYRLTEPFVIKKHQEKAIAYSAEDVLVKPLKISICHADYRYYAGLRHESVLKNKLPMALFHEAVGVVQKDTDNFKKGQKVVMLPNILLEKSDVPENYDSKAVFLSSKSDGFAQNELFLPKDNLIAISDSVNADIFAFTELVSVAHQAIERLKKIEKKSHIVLWGDGSLGFILALCVKHYFPKSRLTIVGISEEKLAKFDFADKVLNVKKEEFNLAFDVGIEVVGTSATEAIVHEFIKNVNPTGNLFLMGVSENPVLIETRMVLEKGLSLYGLSRSTRENFLQAVKFLNHSEHQKKLEEILYKVVDVNSIETLHEAFKLFEHGKGKVVLNWNM